MINYHKNKDNKDMLTESITIMILIKFILINTTTQIL